jgi:hypothetical protein
MRGREAGTLDELRASAWLAEQARAAGLEPGGDDGTYFQFWPLRRSVTSAHSTLTIDGAPVALGTDAVVTFPTDGLKDKIREFSRQPLADLECFSATLDLTEALSDTATEERRARAWATADLETLESLPPLPNPYVPCAMAVLSSEVAKEIIPTDIREQLYSSWMEAAVKSLSANETTLAIVPLGKLTRKGGYLERLRARGYQIEAPK